MTIPFYKYHGTGNDFILIDNRAGLFDATNYQLIAKLCQRRFGIGADGLILLEDTDKADFSMRYYNADGNPSSMCGNGGRCIVAFAKQLGIIDKKASFIAPDGHHSATITDKGIALKMNDVSKIAHIGKDFFLDTGSPHYVKIIPSHENWDTVAEGRKIRYNKQFAKEGTNVNFLSFERENLHLSTYERGVEDETYSCGTGTVAAAIVAGLLNNEETHGIVTKGGRLRVSYKKRGETFSNIVLEGNAKLVFEGILNNEFFTSDKLNFRQ